MTATHHFPPPPWLEKKGKKALIKRVSEQDRSDLSEQLLSIAHEVWGRWDRSSSINTWRIDHLYGSPWKKNLRLKACRDI